MHHRCSENKIELPIPHDDPVPDGLGFRSLTHRLYTNLAFVSAFSIALLLQGDSVIEETVFVCYDMVSFGVLWVVSMVFDIASIADVADGPISSVFLEPFTLFLLPLSLSPPPLPLPLLINQKLLNLLQPIRKHPLIHIHQQLLILQKHLQQPQLINCLEFINRLNFHDVNSR